MRIRVILAWQIIAFATLAAWLTLSIVHRLSETADIIMSVTTFSMLAACWAGSLYIWFRIPSRSVAHVIALIFLVPFGFVWGWAYIIFAARDVPVRAKSAASELS